MAQKVANIKQISWIKMVWTMLLLPFQRQLRIIFQNSTLTIQEVAEISRMGSWMPLEHPKEIKIHSDMMVSAPKTINLWQWPKEAAINKTWYITWTLDKVLKLNEALPVVEVLDLRPFQVYNSTKQWPIQIIQELHKAKEVSKEIANSRVVHKHHELTWEIRN